MHKKEVAGSFHGQNRSFFIDNGQTLEPGLRLIQSLFPDEYFFLFGSGHKKREIMRDPCTGRACQVLLMVRISPYFYAPLDNGQTLFYSLVWGRSDSKFQRNTHLKMQWAYLAVFGLSPAH